MDRSSKINGFLQRRNAKIKLITVIIFILTVISYRKYEIIRLIPFIPMLMFLTISSNVSIKSIFIKIITVSPFVVFIGILNPFFDNSVIEILGYKINGGIISFISIILRFILTVWASFLLISSTKFIKIVEALKELKIPAVLSNQFYFLYRYIRLFLQESLSIWRARVSRLGNEKKLDIKIFSTLAGSLFIRSMRRSNGIYNAMLSRGFNGNIPYIGEKEIINKSDILFFILSLILCIFFRISQ